jgi:hypothetical protein
MAWRQDRPETITAASMQEMVDQIGEPGNERLRVGVTFIWSLLENDEAVLERSLKAFVSAAQESGVPVLIVLDGQNWWQSRSDLWNWWDPGMPGFDPANRGNVEWTGWSPDDAVKIGWRNWGQQIRVAPAPNLFAPRVRREVQGKLAGCAGVVARWYRSLPAGRKYLFGGVRVGWEASLNVNAYYHRDGNRIFDERPHDGSKDPMDHDAAKGFEFGHPGLGYAAATSLGRRSSGPLTIRDHEFIVHRYLAEHAAVVRRAGIPPHLIFTHEGGTYAPWDRHLSFSPAINDDSIPGWSFYSHDPQDCGSLGADMEKAGRSQWAAVEWWRGGATAAEWRERFGRTLTFKRCRLIAVYNWESFKGLKEGMEAVAEVARAR